ncbi:hypothetical protein L596_001685 [Steinernema carpocapsae]|uniref:Uncharacterized protein n=1 Tax=Steinernema carpocapsae TaxID=34508 RepID=A0A4U8ULS8_STECR|nr:hypothetical protein L596_001685 [Steinernema carpocapsae]
MDKNVGGAVPNVDPEAAGDDLQPFQILADENIDAGLQLFPDFDAGFNLPPLQLSTSANSHFDLQRFGLAQYVDPKDDPQPMQRSADADPGPSQQFSPNLDQEDDPQPADANPDSCRRPLPLPPPPSPDPDFVEPPSVNLAPSGPPRLRLIPVDVDPDPHPLPPPYYANPSDPRLRLLPVDPDPGHLLPPLPACYLPCPNPPEPEPAPDLPEVNVECWVQVTAKPHAQSVEALFFPYNQDPPPFTCQEAQCQCANCQLSLKKSQEIINATGKQLRKPSHMIPKTRLVHPRYTMPTYPNIDQVSAMLYQTGNMDLMTRDIGKKLLQNGFRKPMKAHLDQKLQKSGGVTHTTVEGMLFNCKDELRNYVTLNMAKELAHYTRLSISNVIGSDRFKVKASQTMDVDQDDPYTWDEYGKCVEVASKGKCKPPSKKKMKKSNGKAAVIQPTRTVATMTEIRSHW